MPETPAPGTPTAAPPVPMPDTVPDMVPHTGAASPGPSPAPFVGDYLLYLMARASHALSAEFHARLRRTGTSVPEWRVMATLSALDGGEAGGETVGALAAACLMQQPTMTKLLDRMERAGLVARDADARDRRRVTVRLTATGRDRVAGLIAAARAHEAEAMARLGPLGHELKAALRRLLAGESPDAKGR